jgi:hypothetical protein
LYLVWNGDGDGDEDEYEGDEYEGDEYEGDEYEGDEYVEDEYEGDEYEGDEYVGDEYEGDGYVGDEHDWDEYGSVSVGKCEEGGVIELEGIGEYECVEYDGEEHASEGEMLVCEYEENEGYVELIEEVESIWKLGEYGGENSGENWGELISLLGEVLSE